MVLLADDLLTVTSQSRRGRVRMRAELAGLIAVAGRSGRITACRGRSRRWCSGRMVALVMMTREGQAGHRRCGNPCCLGGCCRRSVGGWRTRQARGTHSRCHRNEQYDCQRGRDDQSLAAR